MVDRGNEEEDRGEGEDEEGRARTSRQESDESSLDLKNYLRDDILETVDECLVAWEKGRNPRPADAVDPLHRCAVCTLPHGTCLHSRQWLESRHAILDPLPKDNIDMAMDDISDVLAPAAAAFGGATKHPHNSVPSLSTLQWETLCGLPADVLSGKKVDLSSPLPRAGHSMVLLDGAGSSREDTRLLVVFGGALFACGKTTQSSDGNAETDKSSRNNSDGEVVAEGEVSQQALRYHADVHVFRVGLGTWHCPEATGDLPEGRYGHVSLALGGETMWMFGGRLQGGHQAGDTYVLDVRDMRWERTNDANNGEASPAPRVWSAAAVVRERVILFGGTDLRSGRVFDDVWTWHVQTRRWGEQIVVGSPPLARYGHALLGCQDSEKVLVLGGCCVSSVAEEGLPEDHDQLQLRVRVAADKVNDAYQNEEDEIVVGAFSKYAKRGGSLAGGSGWNGRGSPVESSESNIEAGGRPQERRKGFSRHKARLAAAVASRERDTALREEQLRTVLYEHAAMTYWAKLRSQNPLAQMDATFLDTESMIWRAPSAPAAGGCGVAPPSARMHFAAVALGDKVVLWGGCLPTSKRVEVANGAVHVFDLVHHRWSRPLAEHHPEGIRPRVDAAAAQLRRAERALFEATQRAMTLGAPGGRTMQVVQAEAVIAVNKWRVRKLEDEIRGAVSSPRPRAAHAGCAVGHRVMYFGGWGAKKDRKGELLVMDMEHPRAKESRLEDEFHLRLERERQAREAAEAKALRRTAMQERMRKDLELAREAAEKAVMAAEDARSDIPELTVAPTPRLRCANSTTLWLEWSRPTVDAMGNAPDDYIEYTLYMRGGFREWEAGDRVLVEYMTRAQRKAATAGSSTISTRITEFGSLVGETSPLSLGGVIGSNGVIASDPAGVIYNGCGNEDENSCSNHGGAEEGGTVPLESIENTAKLLPAVITDTSAGGGLFDIRWDDGERERNVRRYRIHREVHPPPPWAAIYEGGDNAYEVEGLVPEYVVEREKAFPYETSAEFSLQTKGTEVPREKRCKHSPVVTFRTKFGGRGPPVGYGGFSGQEGSQATLKARLATAKALDGSISSSASITKSSLSKVHLMHGQYVGTGKGRLYL